MQWVKQEPGHICSIVHNTDKSLPSCPVILFVTNWMLIFFSRSTVCQCTMTLEFSVALQSHSVPLLVPPCWRGLLPLWSRLAFCTRLKNEPCTKLFFWTKKMCVRAPSHVWPMCITVIVSCIFYRAHCHPWRHRCTELHPLGLSSTSVVLNLPDALNL